MHTDDGDARGRASRTCAATWYPVNDHPLDKASYSFRITVPRGLEAIANGSSRASNNRGALVDLAWEATSRWRRT